MAKPQRIKRDGKTYYRVQIRRPKKGINLDEYFSTKRAADRFLRQTEHAIDEGRPISQNVLSSETFEDAVKIYVEDPDAYKTPRRRTLKPSAQKDRKNRTLWLAKHCFGSILLKNITWEHIDKVLSKRSKERSWSPASRYRYINLTGKVGSAGSVMNRGETRSVHRGFENPSTGSTPYCATRP